MMTPSLASVIPGISGAELDAMRDSAAAFLTGHGFTALTMTDPAGEFAALTQSWQPPDVAARGAYDKVAGSHFMLMSEGPAA
jgi:hypothetical protein